MGNQTTVTNTILANALVILLSWALQAGLGVTVPATVLDAAQVVLVAVLLYVAPENVLSRKRDHHEPTS